MIFSATDLEGVIAIDLERQHDNRGYFARTMCRGELASQGLVVDYAQDSTSFNRIRGTLRGMHYQKAPFTETKIVRCVQGAVYDVLVDMRPDSKTYLAWQSFELSAGNGRALYIPEGVAQGFQTLADTTVVHYRISVPYAAHAAAGIRYDDPLIAIVWPEPVAVISEKDASWPDLERYGERRPLRAVLTEQETRNA
ncbi:dTDP-4-dehydrorhamnose 3,5-epimerase family protein [Bosea sp. (in: a-proteobacteria)]|jgi:dTDP-4-dehydrorhamnose 3,5-epimerase|uniref:dTDP-4-dehydrorhamnose 3,5-epimerase family protein n=1 Tax=Bosea sp. (in: a-proteobacteria) TaxID=1871050 RepID=UPI003F6F7377